MCFKNGTEIKWVVDVVKVGLKSKHYFFRGEAEPFLLPMPGIFRERDWPFLKRTNNTGKTEQKKVSDFDHEETEGLRGAESNLIYKFKRLAPGLKSDLPGEANPLNNLNWLFLMQHHGMPTRLLDWTQNILVAVFNAVFKPDDKDGQLWTIMPKELNSQSEIGWVFPLPGNPVVEYLAREMLYDREAKLGLLKKLKLQPTPNWPVAILPPLAWPRMIAQSSAFTLHPKPTKSNAVFPEEAELRKHVIPAKDKKRIRGNLREMGILYRTLYPELDSIAKDEKSRLDDDKV